MTEYIDLAAARAFVEANYQGRRKKMKIKRCPYCKTPRPWLVRIYPLRWIFTKYYVECWACHFCGETKIGKKRAIEAWNRRADDGKAD